MSITRELANFVNRAAIADLPGDVVERTKCLVLDNLGAAIAGSNSAYARTVFDIVKNNTGKSTIFHYGHRAPPLDAALVNAVMINTLGQDDMLYIFHGGQIVLPTALAVGEEQGSSGADLITALVVGYDVMARVYHVAPSIISHWRGVPVFGPFGAAAAAGKLLKLTEDQLTSALGFAANWSSGLTEWANAGTTEAKFHCGMAARNGITGALLARGGALAAETSLEGKAGFYQAFAAGAALNTAVATQDLGKKFYIMEVTYKPYPVCGTNQVPVDLALGLVKKHGIKGADIASIAETMPKWGTDYAGVNNPGPFTTRFQAQMSTQFALAASFLGKPISSFAFIEKEFADPQVGALARTVKVTGEAGRSTTRLEVALRDGRRVSAEGPAGELVPSPVLVPDFEHVRRKFEGLAAGFVDKAKMEKIIDTVSRLEKVGSVSELTRELG